MRNVCVSIALYNIFIKGKENAGGIDIVDLNILNIYVRDVVTVFKLFYWGSPPNEKNFALLFCRYVGAI